MTIGSDFTIDYGAKTVTHVTGTSVYTVNELYSYLQDTFDELGQLDDNVPMSAQTPTDYTLINGWTMPDASFKFLKTGAVTGVTGTSLWTNVYTLGTIESGTQIYIVQNGATLASWWTTGHIDVLIKVKSAGALIDSGNLTIFAREWTDTFDHYVLDASAGGRQAVPLATSDDLNNQTVTGTVSGWTDVVTTFGTVSKDLNNGDGANNYDVSVDCGGRILAQVYERLKYVTRRGESTHLAGKDGEFYVSITGSYTPIKAAPFGTYAGGKFFGARGVWLENYSATDAKNFQLIDSSGATQIPPNVVSVIITSVVSGDRILVALDDGAGAIDKTQYTLDAGNNIGDADILIKEAIATDTPSVGVIRIGDDRYAYTSWTTKTFTLSGTLSQSYAENASCYVPIIDMQAVATSASNTLTYNADLNVIIRVRKKGILPFETTGVISSAGLSVAAIRTTDTIVT
jgi:hypothetical protein